MSAHEEDGGQLLGIFTRRRSRPGVAPGTIKPDPEAPPPIIHAIRYDATELEERTIEDVEDLRGLLAAAEGVTWINVDGLGRAATLRAIGEIAGLHSLALEDVVNVHQRPKVEDYEDHLFVVTRMLRGGEALESEQVSVFLGDGWVLTFQEREGDCLEPLRARLRAGKGRVRRAPADYLAYAILDAIVDELFPLLELYGERLESIEDETLGHPTEQTVARIHGIKRDLLVLRRAIWPQREMINRLLKDESGLVAAETKIYLRDSYDHAVQLIDMLENYRELAASVMDIYLSTLSNRMNEVMKVLTIIATIFIPLSFVAGLYGMNFDTKHGWNMPELSSPVGYPVILAVMAAMALVMLWWFRRRRWI